jgi:hypothetical protein
VRALRCCLSRLSVWHLDLDSQRLSSEEEMKMNPEVKARWVAALRSGEYLQGTSTLRIGDQFCCLGVLCDIYSAERGGGNWTNHGFVDAYVEAFG